MKTKNNKNLYVKFIILLVLGIVIITIPKIVFAYEVNGFISPIKSLDIEFKINIYDYIKENYRDFSLNIIIPDKNEIEYTQYINFVKVENLEGGIQDEYESNINNTVLCGNDRITNPNIVIKNIISDENYFKLKLKTDYKMELNDYIKAVENEKYIMVHFEIIAKEKKGNPIITNNNTIEGYHWDYVNEKVLKSYNTNIPYNNENIDETSLPQIMPLKLKLIYIPNIQ